jgi:membrane protein YdbS with pleckstrin-like domain
MNSMKNIPSKFRKLDKSFVEGITGHTDSSFNPFPDNFSFHGREQDETVILVVRSHWVMYLPHLIAAILVLAIPWILAISIPDILISGFVFSSLLITVLLLSFSILINAYVSWFYNVSIITDERIIDMDLPNVMSHTVSEVQLDKIQDVTDKQSGVLGNVFDIGSVYIQTAGSNQDVEFQNISRPRDVHDTLSDLLDMKEEGKV